MSTNMSAFRKSVAGLLVGQLTRLGLQAVYFVLLARMLGASGYGSFAAALALSALVTPFTSLGANTLMLKNVARNNESAASEWKRAVTYTLLGGLVLSLAITALAGMIAPQDLSRIALFQIAVAELIGLKLVELTGSLWQGTGRNRPLAILPSVLNLFRLIAAAAVFLFMGEATLEMWSTLYLIATLPMGIFVTVQTTIKLGYARGGLRLRREEIKEGLQYSVGLSSQNIYNDIDKAMLARLSSVNAAGLYSAAFRIIDMAYAPIRSVAAAAYPHFFREGEDGLRPALKLTRKISPIVALLGVSATTAAILMAPLGPLVLGPNFTESIDIIRLLAPLILLRAATFLAADTLTGSGRQGFRTLAQICVALVNIGLNLFLIPVAGIFGAVVSTLVCEFLLAATLWSHIVVVIMRTRKRSRGRRSAKKKHIRESSLLEDADNATRTPEASRR
ncbi:oligosaccharide flippase family protein [Paenarthrobacter nicotinovorans]|uniref:oligosaccharide flippase family protein n=1 Tax=Paenarthrobacter nicotinovorans TaxID=29320 RepID=UPI003D67C7B0